MLKTAWTALYGPTLFIALRSQLRELEFQLIGSKSDYLLSFTQILLLQDQQDLMNYSTGINQKLSSAHYIHTLFWSIFNFREDFKPFSLFFFLYIFIQKLQIFTWNACTLSEYRRTVELDVTSKWQNTVWKDSKVTLQSWTNWQLVFSFNSYYSSLDSLKPA